MNESGFRIGVEKNQWIITRNASQQSYFASSNNCELITVVEVISNGDRYFHQWLSFLVTSLWNCNNARLDVVPPPQDCVDNNINLFNYGLNNPYDDLIDDFDPYLKYGKGYQNRTAFKDVFLRIVALPLS